MPARRTTGLVALLALTAGSLALTTPAAAAAPVLTQTAEPGLRLTLLHNNDAESALLPGAGTGSSASGYRGGVARFGTLVDELRAEGDAEPGASAGTLLISSGDNYLAGPQLQASLENDDGDDDFDGSGPFYDAVALERMGYDASAVGNHEFDFGPQVFGYFISQSPSTRFVSANIDVSGEPALQQFVDTPPGAPGTLVEWTRTEVDGVPVAIVGATTPRLASISTPEEVTVDEAVAEAVQEAIDAATADGTEIVILTSHLQNIEEDQALVAELSGLDIAIAGGGSELLADPCPTEVQAPGCDVLLPNEAEPVGSYPLLVEDADGVEIPTVTTTGAYGYLGRLVVDIDANGDVVAVDPKSGPVRNVFVAEDDETLPVPADQRDPDPFLVENVEQPVGDFVSSLQETVIAQTEPRLNGVTADVRSRETNLGSLFADALRATAEAGATEFGADRPAVAVQNSGGIRNSLVLGPDADITRFDTFQIAPFSNFVGYTSALPAAQLKQLLERSVSADTNDQGELIPEGRFGQWSGLEFVYDPSLPAQTVSREPDGTVTVTSEGERVRQVVLTLNDDDPANDVVVVRNGRVVPGATAVDVAGNSFTIGQNGDNYPFNLAEGEFINLPTTYQQSLESYLAELGTVTAEDYPEGGLGRIVVGGDEPVAPRAPQATTGARPTDDSCPTGQVPSQQFPDVPVDDTHALSIRCVAWYDVAQGFTDGRFGPGQGVTRGQMAAFLARTIGATTADLPEPGNQFADADGTTHERAIEQLAAAGIVMGHTDGRFQPDSVVTRAQMTSFLVRTYEYVTDVDLPLPATPTQYFDDAAGLTQQDDVNRAAAVGLTEGTRDRTFSPQATTLRGQMATFLARLLDVLVEDGVAFRPTS